MNSKIQKNPKKVNKYIYWIPRILSIILILFMILMSFDVISPELSFWQILLGLFMHNIPVFILIAVLIISWKREIVGGIAFILAGLLYITLMLINIFKSGFEWFYLVWILQISGVAFLIAILFLVGWYKKK